MNNFRIFNHSSESMSELEDESIDLVVTDPPFNIGACFDGNIDKIPHENYVQIMQRVVSEIGRVVKPEGLSLLLAPERVQSNGETHDYPELFLKLAENVRLRLRGSFSYSMREDREDCVSFRDWKDIDPTKDYHSQEIRGMLFGNPKAFPTGKVYNYTAQEGHPCPYPVELVKDILDTFFTPGQVVLDTFMGTANLGVEVLKRKGLFVGYEIAENYFKTSKRKLEAVS